MADALDYPADIGPNNEALERLEQLLDFLDPETILIECEELDLELGLTSGTSLQQYYISLTIRKGNSK